MGSQASFRMQKKKFLLCRYLITQTFPTPVALHPKLMLARYSRLINPPATHQFRYALRIPCQPPLADMPATTQMSPRKYRKCRLLLFMCFIAFLIPFLFTFSSIFISQSGLGGVYVFPVFNGVHAENTASSQCSGVAGKMALEEVVRLKPRLSAVCFHL